jgi:hypothetical protein
LKLVEEMSKRMTWDEKRALYIEVGMANLPEGALAGLSDKAQAFYLSLRGQYREYLSELMKHHDARLQEVYGDKQIVLGEMRKRTHVALVKLMRCFDIADKGKVMELRVRDVGGLVLTGMAEAGKWLEELR